MEKYLVAIDEFCTSHKIEISFISSLNESGLIETHNDQRIRLY